MPIAFFTRTQTGALISRLNNDVIGAQTAVTGTLGSVVSNVIVLVTTLIAMLALEWRLTLLALVVLPVFVIPARRVGVRLQSIAQAKQRTPHFIMREAITRYLEQEEVQQRFLLLLHPCINDWLLLSS